MRLKVRKRKQRRSPWVIQIQWVHKPGIRGICASHINTASIKDKKAELGNLLLSADMNLTGIIANYWGEDNQDTIKL